MVHNRTWHNRVLLIIISVILAVTLCSCVSNAVRGGSTQESLLLIDEGRANVVLVTADAPSPIVSLAIEELIDHMKRSTGVSIKVVPESDAPVAGGVVRIFIGKTNAAGAVGLDTEQLESDAFILHTEANDLYILGREDDQGYHPRGGCNGTLYGTYELIERALGVRWLWPGELGTYVPQHRTVQVAPVNETVTMTLGWRVFRTGHISRQIRQYQEDVERLAFSKEGLENYYRELRRFMRRHRLGVSRPWPTLHHQSLAKNYFDKHPKWFAMNEAGQRVGPVMCVTNRQLHQFHTESQPGSFEGLYKNPRGGDFYVINLEEADDRSYCHCPSCLAWDEPQPKDWPYHITSNRYARYAAAVRDLAHQKNPGVDLIVGFLAYMDRLHAPTIDIDLSDVYVIFCPWFSGVNPYYPMPESKHEFLKKAWLGWQNTGAGMYYRPNYLLSYVMPHLSTWQSGQMFKYTASHGSEGVDFDSLSGQWATKGPMLYMHMRLASDPTLEIAQLRKEYFSAFGPAAEKVEAYFDYWEHYSGTNASSGGVSYGDATRAHLVYPPQSFVPAHQLLDEAMTLVTDSPKEYVQRVAFLQAGLKHARLAADFTSKLDFPGRAPSGSKDRFDAARAALKKLIQFRRDHEHLFIADYIMASFAEKKMDVGTLLDGEFIESDGALAVGDMLQPWGIWYYRKDPEDLGIQQRWFQADRTRSSKGLMTYDIDGRTFDVDRKIWTQVRVPARLNETAVGDYLGYGWYVTTFTGPQEWSKKLVVIFFAAVDEQAWVYVNGQYVGEHTMESEKLGVEKLYNRPFRIEVPAGLIRPGQQNLLVVRTHASIGASGIWGPVAGAVNDD